MYVEMLSAFAIGTEKYSVKYQGFQLLKARCASFVHETLNFLRCTWHI